MARKKYKIPEQQIGMFNFDTPSMPVLDVARCEVRLINHETAARMVETYHYAHRVPGIIKNSIGLFVDDVAAGCIIYSSLMNNISSSICGDEYINNVLELSRLFIYDWAGKNTESWFIGQSFKFLPKDICILLSYSDMEQNHLGVIYQATNWLYTGISIGSNGREYITPNGEILTRRSNRFKNGNNGKLLSWQEIQKSCPGIQKVKSSPKHRYVYFLGSKKQRKELRKALKWPVLPYPKREEKT